MAKPILIAGPTASGKTALALALAREFDGVIINADSCQVYRELSIISARPTLAEMGEVPHFLFGHVSGAAAYSTGAWLRDVAPLLARFGAEGRRVIFVGGTGLYFQALIEGLSEVPEIAADVRQHWREEAERQGARALHEKLREMDPVMAARLEPGDTQRIVRALEVWQGTGRSLSEWQAERSAPLIAAEAAHKYVLSWPREILYERINQRFGEMVAAGGLEEVRALAEAGLGAELPMMRALGVPELMRHINGEAALEAAIALAAQQTRRYAKRQMTWLRGNMIAWEWLESQEMERKLPEIVSKIHQSG